MSLPLSDGPRDPSFSQDELQAIDAVRARFERAWREALPGAEGPTVEAHLDGVAERLRPALQVELERIDRQSRQDRQGPKTQPEDGTVSLPGSPSEATVDLPRAHETEPADGPGATVSLAPPSNPDEPLTADFGAPLSGPTMTGDFTPGSPKAKPETAHRRFPDVPGYQILGELGRGGMGVVYKAQQARAERLVALKMILSGAHAAQDELDRFSAEARSIASLNHPNIVQIFEVGEHEGLPFFSLEYVDGGNLARMLDGQPMSPRAAAELTVKLARAMAAAHAIPIIHRDLKPANILMTRDGQPKVTDFGLAKRLDDDSGMTRSGSVMGTPSYMSPEQAWGRAAQIGVGSDIYSLGAILYDLTTGRPPFRGVTTLETLDLVRHAEPIPPAQLQPKLPADLDTICLKCLDKDPARRYESASHLADDLQRFLDGRPILARPVSKAEQAWRWAKRNPVVAGLSSAVATLLVTVAVVSSVLTVQANDARDAAVTAQNNETAERLKAVKARDAEVVARKDADRNAEVAQEQLAVSIGTVRDLVLSVQDELRKRPEFLPIRERVLRIARKGIDRVRSSYLENPLVDRTEAAISVQLGTTELLVGRVEEARAIYERAARLLRDALKKNPKDPIAHRNLAAVLNQQGDVEIRIGDMAKARALYQEALELRQAWRKLNPENPRIGQALAESCNLLGRVDLLLGDVKAARARYEEAQEFYKALPEGLLDVPETRRDLASLDEKLGLVALREGSPAAAETLLRGALVKRVALKDQVQGGGASPVLLRDIALSQYNIGDLYLANLNDPAKAWNAYEKSLRNFSLLLRADPEGYNSRRDVAMLYYRAGETARRLKARGIAPPANIPPPPAAEVAFAQCLKIREALAAIDPKDAQARIELMTALARNNRYADAEKIAEGLRNEANPDARLRFQTACGLALCAANPDVDAAKSARDRAFAALEELVTDGWKDRMTLETEPDLDPIRDDPRLAPILSRLPKAP